MTKTFLKYDDKGNLIEKTTKTNFDSGFSDFHSITLYSNYKFDDRGNWIERKITSKLILTEQQKAFRNPADKQEPQDSVFIYYRTIVYF